MGVGAGLYMYDVVVEKFTFAISSPDEFLCTPFQAALAVKILDGFIQGVTELWRFKVEGVWFPKIFSSP